jgi:Lsr2
MATVKVDDLDNKITEEVEEHFFTDIHGQRWSIDLSPKSVAAIDKVMEPFTKVATPVGSVVATLSRRGDGKAAKIRAWAAEQEPPVEVPARGKIDKDVEAKYDAAHHDQMTLGDASKGTGSETP